MKPKKAIAERMATIMPITTCTLRLLFLWRCPKGCQTRQRRCAWLNRISQIPYIVPLSSLFLIFNADSRVEGVKFQTILFASRLSNIFLIRLSVASVIFVSGALKRVYKFFKKDTTHRAGNFCRKQEVRPCFPVKFQNYLYTQNENDCLM